MFEHRMLIDGQLVQGQDQKSFDNVNPATEEVLGSVADGSRSNMERAVAAARTAFDQSSWSRDHEGRKQALLQLQTALEDEREEMRSELVAEVGCPIMLTYGPQLDAPVNEAVKWPAEQISQFPWRRTLTDKDAFGWGMMSSREVWKEPVGVVGVIVPWNFPLEITLNKLGPVLAMGNTCVIKPAPDTPFNATRLGRLIAEHTDIPPGVVNIVTSSDHAVGEVLTTSPDVDMVAFTGSTATGRRIMEGAAGTLKSTFLELGGKSANIVLDDADFPSAVGSAAAACTHGGQGCAISTRLLVPRSRYQEAVDIITEAMKNIGYGDPTDPGVLQGPQISKRQQERVLGYIEKGSAEGAKLVVGGGVPKHLPRGYFIEPTLFIDVDNKMTIAQEEIFGPVLVVIPFEDDDDAVRIANDSIYGLSGQVTAGNLDRAIDVAREFAPERSVSTAGCGTAQTLPSVDTSSLASDANAASKGWRSSPRQSPSRSHPRVEIRKRTVTDYEFVKYETHDEGRIVRILLNRPRAAQCSEPRHAGRTRRRVHARRGRRRRAGGDPRRRRARCSPRVTTSDPSRPARSTGPDPTSTRRRAINGGTREGAEKSDAAGVALLLPEHAAVAEPAQDHHRPGSWRRVLGRTDADVGVRSDRRQR